MEKYKKWTDGPTGINPFVPFGQYKASFFGTFFFFPLVASKFLLYHLSRISIHLFSTFGSSTRPIVALFYRLLFLSCGVFNINEIVWNAQLQKSVQDLPSSYKGLRFLLSNHVSYLDVFYFAMNGFKRTGSLDHTKFIVMYVDEVNRDIKFQLLSPEEYINKHFKSLGGNKSNIEEQLHYRKANAWTAEELVRELEKLNEGFYDKGNHAYDIIFFFEGTTTNGRGILQYPGNGGEIEKIKDFIDLNRIPVEVVALNYGIGNRRNTDMSFNPACHVENFFSHFIGLLSQFSISIEAKYIIGTKDLFSNKLVNVRKSIANVLPGVLSLSNSDLVEKKDFIKYWKKTQGN